jgi:hypothetical protein
MPMGFSGDGSLLGFQTASFSLHPSPGLSSVLTWTERGEKKKNLFFLFL